MARFLALLGAWALVFTASASGQTPEEEAEALIEWMRGVERVMTVQSSGLDMIGQFNRLYGLWGETGTTPEEGRRRHEDLLRRLHDARDRAQAAFDAHPPMPESRHFPEAAPAKDEIYRRFEDAQALFGRIEEEAEAALARASAEGDTDIRRLGGVQMWIGLAQMRDGNSLQVLQAAMMEADDPRRSFIYALRSSVDGVEAAFELVTPVMLDGATVADPQSLADMRQAEAELRGHVETGRRLLQARQLGPGDGDADEQAVETRIRDQLAAGFDRYDRMADQFALMADEFEAATTRDEFGQVMNSRFLAVNRGIRTSAAMPLIER